MTDAIAMDFAPGRTPVPTISYAHAPVIARPARTAPSGTNPESAASPHQRGGRRGGGFTLIELLVVISIIAVLAGMLLPAINMVRASARKTSCGSQQHQIIIAALSYANDQEQLWPVRPTGTDGTFKPIASADGLATTAGSLEYLCVQNGKELPVKLFTCPAASGTASPDPSLNLVYSAGTSAWANTTASPTPVRTPYAYDWSVPTAASSGRVVLADRGNGVTNHLMVIMAACADGHVITINLLGSMPSGNITDGYGGKEAFSAFNTQISSDDDVYSDVGDDLNTLRDNAGSATRCFLR
jgi:prepilin-type N-terminal cleavage/methylation domain-containing protein